MTVRNMGDLPHVSCIVVDEDTVRYGSGEFRRVRTCRNVYPQEGIVPNHPETMFRCSECRCKVEMVGECGNEYGEVFSTPLTPLYCPNCGAKVVEA